MTENFTPPTDNLYKFMALSGTSLVLLCLYLCYHLAMTQNARAEGLFDRMLEVELERKAVEIMPPSDAARPAKEAAATVREEALKARLDWVVSQRKLVQTVMGVLGIGLAIGLGTAYRGFKWWYERIQVFEDECLRAEAAASRAANAAPPA